MSSPFGASILSPRMGSSDLSRRSSTADSFLTPEERHYYAQLYKAADSENRGIIGGQEAVSFFGKSGVPQNVLGDIWQLADKEGKGFLTQQTFSIAVKLIAAAQNGKQPSTALINSPVPLPVFEGIYIEPFQPAEDKANNITPDEREKYAQMFTRYNPAGGVLDGK
ncbi:hypothetical protein BC936DRAFT_137169 [Jimgerdemannia flammicorona]|uniref:EH domain-containing protein n=1 Tax=Jimgerdemannia flammicorona TaxID=994334 RepID=A0A433CXY0_9FUNG|nr:hypothetical protein BC936DRAFT_137169 [Jimgerdemannia flammicorona]